MTRPTLVSLARELGVSRQTVSNVINAPHLVKPDTRERVQKAIEESGYRPNVAAQALRSRRSRTVAMRIYPSTDGISGAVMDRFLHQLVAECRVHGYNLMPITAVSNNDEVDQLLTLYERGSIDACLLSGTSARDGRPARLSQRKLPFATFGRPWHDLTATHYWVDVDGASATHKVVDHLWGRGFRRIGFIGFEPGSGPGDERRRGWREAIAQLDPTLDAYDSAAPDTIESGEAHAIRLLAAGADSLVCASDSLAFGATLAMRNLSGLESGQAPVVGFDDSSVAHAMGFSSVAQPVEPAVHLLMHALLEEIGPVPSLGMGELEGVLLEAEPHFRGRLG